MAEKRFDFSGSKVEVVEVDLATQEILTFSVKAKNNFDALSQKHNATTQDVEDAINTLDTEVKALSGLDEEGRASLTQTINDLKGLSGSVVENILSGQNIIADRVNKMPMMVPLKATYDDVNGIVFDLSGYGFATKDDYSINVSMENDIGKTAKIQKAPVDGNSYAVKAIDTAMIEAAQKPYNPTDKGSFNVVGTLAFTLEKITLNTSDMEGDVHEIGGDED